jgi:hypothetical protein
VKEFDVEKIVASVQSAIDGLHLHDLPDDVHRAATGRARESEMDISAGQEVEKEFQVGARPRLSVGNLHGGEVSIRAGADSVIRVRARRFGAKRTVDELPFEVTQEGSLVSVRPRGKWHGSAVDYRIEVPRDCAVHVRGLNPDVDIEGTSAEVEVETVGGGVRVQDVSGACSVTTISGDVSGHRIDGTLNVHTTSGDATVMESRLRRFTLHSVSGDFTVETSLTPDEHYLVGTTSGDLRLLLSGNVGATVQMKSFSGEVVSELPTEVIKSSRRNWQGRIYGGGAYLEVTSMSGDLQIERGSDVSADVSHREAPAATVTDAAVDAAGDEEKSPETGAILAALERGEMTVEEAMARLEGLG